MSSNFFVDTLGTLGQHEFAFGFCGSTGSLVVVGSMLWLYQKSYGGRIHALDVD